MTSAGMSGNAGPGPKSDQDLLGALTGTEAAHERAVAYRTRRVVAASLGVMQEQKAGRRRTRSLALVSILLVILAMGPFIWRVADDVIGGERWCDMATQTSLWVCILLPAVLAAALVAGWLRREL
ncbi:MAG TPA: hypothetical protein VME23_21570 [Terracidiphilus sp.]|nr:hypothetical protein [Terracidiphilus sp.]